jgi:hypothetical protein
MGLPFELSMEVGTSEHEEAFGQVASRSQQTDAYDSKRMKFSCAATTSHDPPCEPVADIVAAPSENVTDAVLVLPRVAVLELSAE